MEAGRKEGDDGRGRMKEKKDTSSQIRAANGKRAKKRRKGNHILLTFPVCLMATLLGQDEQNRFSENFII